VPRCPGSQVVQADPRADLISTIDIGSWANVHPVILLVASAQPDSHGVKLPGQPTAVIHIVTCSGCPRSSVCHLLAAEAAEAYQHMSTGCD
jgi:hypothetical protein